MVFMSFKYSQNLIDRTVKYFKEKYNHEISDEVANEYLSSLSGFFLAFVRPSIMDGGRTVDTPDCSMGSSNTHRTL